jgi:hypothetical protein|tara:strand:+ start:43 stop:336 length:294 start_codon:yes stop_codon:yes gene_type:complete
MSNQSKKTIKQLQTEIGRDFKKYTDDFYKSLVSLTPIDSGRAKSGWVYLYNNQIGKKTSYKLFTNKVPYVGVLDNGWSKQAPKGMFEPTVKRTRQAR